MDMLEPADMSEFFDGGLLDLEPMEAIELTPDEEALVSSLVEKAKAITAAKAQLCASRRKREDLTNSPSQKISIRIPRPLLNLLRDQAADLGVPYQTYIKVLLHNAALRQS